MGFESKPIDAFGCGDDEGICQSYWPWAFWILVREPDGRYELFADAAAYNAHLDACHNHALDLEASWEWLDTIGRQGGWLVRGIMGDSTPNRNV